MCRICRNDYDDSTVELYCSYCPDLTSIPSMLALRQLYCSDCPQLISFSRLPALQRLVCFTCPKLIFLGNLETSIDEHPFPALQRLHCADCPNLTSIGSLSSLQFLDCSKCPKLTSIGSSNPIFGNLSALQVLWYSDCPSLFRVPKSFVSRKLIKQKDYDMYEERLARKRLEIYKIIGECTALHLDAISLIVEYAV